jgi:hypothetical protein
MELPNWGECMEDWEGLEKYLHDKNLLQQQLLEFRQ